MSGWEAAHKGDPYCEFEARCYKIFKKIGGDWWDISIHGGEKRLRFVRKVWDLPEEERELRIAMLLLGG